MLAGHIHRHQVLTQDLGGRPLGAPVFYPGSVERTAFAEEGESKPAKGRRERGSREEEREAVVQKYQQMAEDDDVSAAAVSAELKTLKTAKKQRDYLVDMRASAFSLSFLLLLL